MSYSNFPSYAQFLTDGFLPKVAGGVERSEYEDGFVHQVPTHSLARYEVPVSYRLDSVQKLQDFRHWRDKTLANGALYFAWTEPTHPASADFEKPRRARIVGGEVSYRATTDRLDDWTATMVIEYWK